MHVYVESDLIEKEIDGYGIIHTYTHVCIIWPSYYSTEHNYLNGCLIVIFFINKL